MPNNSNISEEDYLDSLLRAVSAGKDEFELGDELDLDVDLDEQFEAEFEAELKAEFASNEDIEIKEKTVKNTMAASNSVFTDDDGLSEEDRAFSTEIKNSVLSSVMQHEENTGIENQNEPEIQNELEIHNEPEVKKEAEIQSEPEAYKEEHAVEEFLSFEDNVLQKDEPVENAEVSEEEDITNQLAAMLGGMGDTDVDVKEEKVKPTKEEIKAEKARIKANRKAAKEAAKIAKQAEKARKAATKAKTKQEDDNLVNSMADIFDSANDDLRREYDEKTLQRGRTAEEKSIDNSVDAELADLGLDALFNQIGQSFDEPEKTPVTKGKKNYEEEAFEEDIIEKNIKEAKKKKEKKPKKKKEKKPKPAKKKKPPKPKKVKKPDEIIPIPVPLLLLGLSFTALLVVAVTIGGNTYYYNTCMDKAVNYYVNKNYQAAYREISGLKIKEKDEFFCEQVKVVMTVESNYDMFKSMMRIGEYNEALDLLLKGVDNFDLYQNDAREWEAFDDLEVSLRRVVDALEKYYGITESQAREINLIEGQLDYSRKVAELAANVNYDKNEPFADETTTAPETTTGTEGEENTSQSEEETFDEN